MAVVIAIGGHDSHGTEQLHFENANAVVQSLKFLPGPGVTATCTGPHVRRNARPWPHYSFHRLLHSISLGDSETHQHRAFFRVGDLAASFAH